MRVAVLDDYQGVAESLADWKSLPAGTEVVFFRDHVADDADLVARLAGYEAVVVMRERTPLRAPVLARLPMLRLIATPGMVNASIDIEAAQKNGIVVSGTPSTGTATVELTWALILAAVRNVAVEDAELRAGRWQTRIGIDLPGRTLGLLGLGKLGRKVALIGQAFGMDVIAWSQNLTPESAAEVGVTHVEFDQLLERSDVLSIHTVLSRRTRGIIGAAELARMKPTAYLVNTSRGPVVDEAALIEALRSGQIAGAGLDVFDTEPLPDGHPLLTAPNTVLTPHVGFVTRETYAGWYAALVENVAAFIAGSPIRVLQPLTSGR